MTGLTEIAARVLRCPACAHTLEAGVDKIECTGTPRHAIDVEDGILVFARPEVGKYQGDYASRYAGLWTFGFETVHTGLTESLYRTVSSLLAEALADAGEPHPVIVDAGCGVGRVTADAACLSRDGTVISFDASPAMLSLARKIVSGRNPVRVELSSYGFSELTIPAYGLDGPLFARADVQRLPLVDGCADVVLSVNVIDRLPQGPESAFPECHRILKTGGTLIFTDPLNWTETRMWERYSDAAAVLDLLSASGFLVRRSFDDLRYSELIDARGSFDTYRTVVASAIKR